MSLTVTLVTPTERVVSGLKVDQVVLPAAKGEVTVLPGHAPLLTSLGAGNILTHSETEDINFLVTYGFAEVRDDHVSIFADSLEAASELDLEKAMKAKAEAEETVMNTVLGELEYAKYMKDLEIAHKRVEMAKLVKDISSAKPKK